MNAAAAQMRRWADAQTRARAEIAHGRYGVAARVLRDAGEPDAQREVLHMRAQLEESLGHHQEAERLEMAREVRFP